MVARTLLRPGAASRQAHRSRPRQTGGVLLTRRQAVLLVLAGLWPLLVWPNFVRVIAGDDRAFQDGPTAFLLVHVGLAVVSMGFGAVLVVLGVRAWRQERRSRCA